MTTRKQCLLLPGALLCASVAMAQTCLQEEYNVTDKQKLNCTANDVRVAQVSNVRGLDGSPLATCTEGSTFSFVADFNIVTTANAANSGGRDNIGLYFQRDPSKPDALKGSCVDNIIAPLHPCGSGTLAGISCGTPPGSYQEFDASPDNCGDTASSVNGNITDTIVVDNFVCSLANSLPCVDDPTKKCLVLPNCTSWQVPGSSNLCTSASPSYPYPAPPAATPGSPSKCNCSVIPLPIQLIAPAAVVQKACTTPQTPGPAAFPDKDHQSPTSCNVGDGTTTEGGTVTYNIAITNTTGSAGGSTGITVDQICDSAYGNVFTATGYTRTTCLKGTECNTAPNNVDGKYCGNSGTTCQAFDIPATGGTNPARCTFTADQLKELTTVTNVVTAHVHADLAIDKHVDPTSNSVSVRSTEVPATGTVTKGFVGTIAGCATVRYSVDVHNTSALDEVLTMSALNDTVYGDITKLGTGGPPVLLGTTCGVATGAPGLGTLSGSTGAGTLPATIQTGTGVTSTYSCQFDGQFCQTLDNNKCITQIDSVSAKLQGDETTGPTPDPVFTQGGNTLTVKECFTATVTSAGP